MYRKRLLVTLVSALLALPAGLGLLSSDVPEASAQLVTGRVVTITPAGATAPVLWIVTDTTESVWFQQRNTTIEGLNAASHWNVSVACSGLGTAACAPVFSDISNLAADTGVRGPALVRSTDWQTGWLGSVFDGNPYPEPTIVGSGPTEVFIGSPHPEPTWGAPHPVPMRPVIALLPASVSGVVDLGGVAWFSNHAVDVAYFESLSTDVFARTTGFNPAGQFFAVATLP